jgi:serine/threonine protein kinase
MHRTLDKLQHDLQRADSADFAAACTLQGINDKRLRAYVAMQGAYGMEYLHLHYMVHFDLKCDNLLCDLRDLNKPVVKIGDLGLSKTKKGSFISGNMRGTLPW